MKAIWTLAAVVLVFASYHCQAGEKKSGATRVAVIDVTRVLVKHVHLERLKEEISEIQKQFETKNKALGELRGLVLFQLGKGKLTAEEEKTLESRRKRSLPK